jgi:hypothetical protein
MHNLILSHPRETDGFSLGLSGLLHAVDRPPPGWHPATGARPRHEAAGCGEEPAAGRGHRASSGTRPLAAAGAEAAGRKAALGCGAGGRASGRRRGATGQETTRARAWAVAQSSRAACHGYRGPRGHRAQGREWRGRRTRPQAWVPRVCTSAGARTPRGGRRSRRPPRARRRHGAASVGAGGTFNRLDPGRRRPPDAGVWPGTRARCGCRCWPLGA